MAYFASFERVAGAALLLALSGCATPVFDQARSHYYAGDPVAAVAVLDEATAADEIPERDRLLVQLERGLYLHRAGLYRDSADSLLKAATYIDDNDLLRLREQAKTLVSNDWSKRYLGEYSEQLWLHGYAMMSFIMAGEPESAAIEARRALKVFDAHGESLEGANYTRALIALSFELAGQYNDAYVASRELQQRVGGAWAWPTYIAARRVASEEGAARARAAIAPAAWALYNGGGPEAVLLISQGRGPQKISGDLVLADQRISFPSYVGSSQLLSAAVVRGADGRALPAERVSSDTLAVAQAALGERGAKVLAKAALRGHVKHELVKELREKDQVAGEILNLALFLLEEADTRGWHSLPARLSMLRVPLPQGATSLRVSVGGVEQLLSIDPTQKTPQVFSLHF